MSVVEPTYERPLCVLVDEADVRLQDFNAAKFNKVLICGPDKSYIQYVSFHAFVLVDAVRLVDCHALCLMHHHCVHWFKMGRELQIYPYLVVRICLF